MKSTFQSGKWRVKSWHQAPRCNCTFLVHFSSISSELNGATVCSFAWLHLTKITMERPSSPDMPLKHTKKRTILFLPYPNSAKIQEIIISNYSTIIWTDRELCRADFVQTFLVFNTYVWFQLISHCFNLLVWSFMNRIIEIQFLFRNSHSSLETNSFTTAGKEFWQETFEPFNSQNKF